MAPVGTQLAKDSTWPQVEAAALPVHHPSEDEMLQAKANQKLEHVQEMIRTFENAIKNYTEEDKRWLRAMMEPNDTCIVTLSRLVVEPKYKDFVNLRCVVLRALQLILRFAQMMITGPEKDDPAVGMMCLTHLIGDKLANEVTQVIFNMARSQGTEQVAACNALLLLAEMGPEALAADVAPRRLLDLFVGLPDRAEDLIEIALRLHSFGNPHREAVLAEIVSHAGGSLLCEVLLQLVNRGDRRRQMRALKVLTGCLLRPGSESLLYTNDARVLVEMLIRELPYHREDPGGFRNCADCFKALTSRCAAVRTHRRSEIQQVFEELYADDQTHEEVRDKCSEVLRIMAHLDQTA